MKKHLTLALPLLLAACGFHLKGLNDDNIVIKNLTLTDTESKHNDAYNTLVTTLNNNHITLTNNSEWKAIISDYQQRQNIVVDTSKSREVELIASYQISLYHHDKKIENTTISNRTNIEYASGQYLGSISDQKEAWQSLNRQNADASLRYLNAIIGNQKP